MFSIAHQFAHQTRHGIRITSPESGASCARTTMNGPSASSGRCSIPSTTAVVTVNVWPRKGQWARASHR